MSKHSLFYFAGGASILVTVLIKKTDAANLQPVSLFTLELLWLTKYEAVFCFQSLNNCVSIVKFLVLTKWDPAGKNLALIFRVKAV